MAFESLSEKLQNVFRNLRSKGRLTETDVHEAMREVKRSLLEADVNYKVVKDFTKAVESEAIGSDVLNGLNPGQTVIKIVRDEMVKLLGSELDEIPFQTNKLNIFMMAGLQGAGKTTTAAKLAAKYKANGKKVLLVAADVYRPAAIEQLQVNAERLGVPVFSMGTDHSPVSIVQAAVEQAKADGVQLLIIDTAGRLQIDEDMMQELADIKAAVPVDVTILVVDAMTGQEAVNVSKTFAEAVGIDGVVLSKCDGDMRGGAALSIRAVSGKPIYYVGMGEKLQDLELFYPDRMAGRILGMGDVLTLIEKAEENIDAEKAAQMQEKFEKAKFGFDDYLESMEQMRKMGGIESMLSMLPGMGLPQGDLASMVDEAALKRNESIIYSMTKEERANPSILNPQRKARIAKGAGCDIAEVNKLVKQFNEAQKLMKQLPGMMGGKKGKGLFGKFKFPF